MCFDDSCEIAWSSHWLLSLPFPYFKLRKIKCKEIAGKWKEQKMKRRIIFADEQTSSLYSLLQGVAYLGNHSISSTDCVASEGSSDTLMMYHNLMFLDGF